jgi:hypothetical protein
VEKSTRKLYGFFGVKRNSSNWVLKLEALKKLLREASERPGVRE